MSGTLVWYSGRNPATVGHPPLDSFCLNQAIYRIPKNEFRKTVNDMIEMLIWQISSKPTRQLSRRTDEMRIYYGYAA